MRRAQEKVQQLTHPTRHVLNAGWSEREIAIQPKENTPKISKKDKTRAGTEGVEDINAIMKLLQPALDASLAGGYKKKKVSLIKYWGM